MDFRLSDFWKARHKRRFRYKSPEYDVYHVMRQLAPPGFVSAFMRDDAVKISPEMGMYVQVARLDKDWLKNAGSAAFKMDELPEDGPRLLTERLELQRYITAMGAMIVFVVDPVEGTLYYWDNEGGPDPMLWITRQDARDHLRRVLRDCIRDY